MTTTEAAHALEQEGYSVHTWSNGPNFSYAAHDHPYDKAIIVLAGSIRFDLPGGDSHELNVEDRLDLPAGTVHSAWVGPRGVTCLEGQKTRAK